MNTTAVYTYLYGIAEWVWKTSLGAALLIGIVLLIGWMAGRRLPPRWRYAMGLLVVARLVLPVSFPGTWGFHQLLPEPVPAPRLIQFERATEGSVEETIAVPVIVSSMPEPVAALAEPRTTQGTSWSWPGLWAGGVVLVFGLSVMRLVLFVVRVRDAQPLVRAEAMALLEECRARLGVSRQVEIRELPKLGTPALFGVFRPKLLLPVGFVDRFNPQEIRMVFLHELAHLKAHDILLNWLIVLVGAVHWFNPLAWLALRRLRQDREILRDAQVLRCLDAKERPAYGETLLRLSEVLSGGVPCPSFIPVVNHRSQTTRRILMIARYKAESRASAFALAAVLVVLALATFSTRGNDLAVGSVSSTPSSYPWSEDSEYVRVGKDLLELISINSVTITNFDTMQFVLTPEFIHVCLLTPDETARLNAAMTNALHLYRTVQGQHWEAADDEAIFEEGRNALPYARGEFRFKLQPFEAEAKEIRERLRSEVVAILGMQRAMLFWQQGEMYLDGEMNTTNHARFLSQTYRYRLLEEVPGPLVDITITSRGGWGGRPYGEALDPYAPEELKPILKRWRQWIARKPRGSFAWSAPASEQTVMHIPPGLAMGKWNDASKFVDLPKPVARALTVPGLTDDELLSAEAIALLRLATNEVHAVNELYQEMKLRTEAVERANLVQPDPEKTSFILRAFPVQAAELRREWLTNLVGLVGPGRAELLDQCIRTPPLPFSRERIRAMVDRSMRGLDPGPRWFDRGQFDLRIDVEKVMGPNGRDALRIRYESDSPESGDLGGSDVPLRFRHLLTPDMLGGPGRL